jgi:hypothetical protein
MRTSVVFGGSDAASGAGRVASERLEAREDEFQSVFVKEGSCCQAWYVNGGDMAGDFMGGWRAVPLERFCGRRADVSHVLPPNIMGIRSHS